MAFDAMGNYTGGYMLTPQEETEEERRRRLGLAPAARESTPVKQTITTDPRTGERKIRIEGSERDLSAANPLTPTVVPAPVSPDMLAVRQVESGNRDFDAQGRPITSPRGAMFASQVMPTTAANPGFGVRPAAAQTPEEYNRVGQDYFNALLQRYGGDREKALAAYNAGPGRVDQNLQANQGQLNRGQLPQETQGYITKVLNTIAGAMSSPAQAAQPPRPAAPVAPGAMRTPQQEAADDQAIFQATGVRPQAAPAAAPAPTEQPALGSGLQMRPGENQPSLGMYSDQQRLVEAGTDANKLVVIAADPNADPNIRQIASRLHASQIRQEDEKARAQKEIQDRLEKNDTLGIAKLLKTGGIGNIARSLLFGYMGQKDLAREELAKAGYGATPSVIDVGGNQAYITTTPNGTPVEGYYLSGPMAGQALSSTELAQGAQGVLGKNVAVSAEVYLDPTTGRRYRSGYDSKTGRSGLVDIQGGPMFRGDPKNLVLQSVEAARQRSDFQLINDLKRKHGENVLEAEKDYTGVYGAFPSDAARNQFLEAYRFSAALPGQGLTRGGAAQPPGATGTAPAAQPAAGAAAIPVPNPTLTQGTAAAKQALDIQGKRSIDFNKKIDTEYAEDGVKADSVVGSRKRQLDILQRVDPTTGRPVGDVIAGYISAPAGSATAQSMTVLRDLIVKGAPEDQIKQRLAALGLSEYAQSALREFEAENVRVAAQSLKEIAGPGAVSQAEQQLNKEANLDIGRTPLLGTYNIIAQSQFSADLKRYKSDYAAGSANTATNVAQFERDWRRISGEVGKAYTEIARKRADFIRQNGATADAVRKGYQKYPVPQYDPLLNNGQGGWRYLKPLDEIMGPR